MVYKKNWFTYLGYILFGLLLAGLILLSSGLHTDLSENNIMKNLILLLVVAVCIFIIWFASYLSSMISNKLYDGKANLLYNILVAVLFAAAVGLRIYYILTHGDVLAIDGFNLFHEELMVTAACALGMAKLIIIYMIGLYAFGKQGAAATLFFEGVLASEIRSCMVLDYANIAMFVVLVVILLYSVYFKRCNSGNMNTVMNWLLTAFITVIISAGIGVSVYFGYSIVIPVVLAVSVILNMLFAGWKQALLPVIGIPVLCAAAYFGVSIIDADYSEQFNSEIEQCMSNAGQLFESPADIFSDIRDYADSSVMPDDDLTFTIPGGYEYNNDVFINMILMCLTLWSLILLFFKKRSSLSAYILFSFGAYLFDSNIVLCNVFILGLCFQELYEGRDRISYVVNSPFIDEVNDEVEDYPVYDDSEADNPISEAAVSDENVTQVHEDDSTSVDNLAYEDSSMSESSSGSADSSVSADSAVSEGNSAYGVSEPEPQEYTESGYGATEPLNYTGSQYGTYNAEDYADSDSGVDETQNYTGSNYGAVDTEEYSDSGYGTDEPQNYTGSNYGAYDTEEYSDSGYETDGQQNYSASNYGAYDADEYAGSDNGTDEPQNYTGSNYGAVDTEEYSDSGYGTDEPQNYTGSNYGAYSAEEYTDSDNETDESHNYTGSNYGAYSAKEYTDSDNGTDEPRNYTGSNYGAYSAKEYTDSDNGTDEPQNYTASNYGAYNAEEYADSDNGTDEPQNYTGSNYGAYNAEEYAAADDVADEPQNYTASNYGAYDSMEYDNTDNKTAGDFHDDIMDRLPVPKPVSAYIDENTENVVIKKSTDNLKETADNSFDKDMWQNRRKRMTKQTQDSPKGDFYE